VERRVSPSQAYGSIYFPDRKFSKTVRINDPPYAPAIPGRNARNEAYTCARDGFTVRKISAASSVSGMNTPTRMTQRHGDRGRNNPSIMHDAVTISAINNRSLIATFTPPVTKPQKAAKR